MMMTPPRVTRRLARRSTKSRRLPFAFDMTIDGAGVTGPADRIAVNVIGHMSIDFFVDLARLFFGNRGRNREVAILHDNFLTFLRHH